MNDHELHLLAESFVGVPWVEFGRDGAGLDCLGLVVLFHAKRGIVVPDVVSRDPREVLGSNLASAFVKVAQYKCGDVVKFGVASNPDHLGIALKTGVLNATKRHGVVVAKWRGVLPLVSGYFRHWSLVE